MDENHFNLITFHPGDNAASQRLPSAALLRPRHPPEADSLNLKCLACESLRLVQNSSNLTPESLGCVQNLSNKS